MNILNLYAGIGGNRWLWGDEHQITAVEIDERIADAYKELFPSDSVVVGDAHEFLLHNFKDFDFIWTSPPCTYHSCARHGTPAYVGVELYQEIELLKRYCKYKLWVVENVQPYYEYWIPPTVRLGRHPYWANFPIRQTEHKETHIKKKNQNGKLCNKSITELQDGLEIDLSSIEIVNKGLLLRNAVDPKTGLHILNEAIRFRNRDNRLRLTE